MYNTRENISKNIFISTGRHEYTDHYVRINIKSKRKGNIIETCFYLKN